jgi:hypothetical protein
MVIFISVCAAFEGAYELFLKKITLHFQAVPGLGITFFVALPPHALLLGAPKVCRTQPKMSQYEETSDI